VPVAPSVSGAKAAQGRADEAVLVAAAQAGDDNAFAALVERHRRELQLHCYRMLGSLEDAEDLVQETFLRAWRKRESVRSPGRASLRSWLYRIATNACLDSLRTRPRRLLPSQLGPAANPPLPVQPPVDLPWLQPYPDRLIAPAADEPEAAVVARETVEIAFLAALQLLTPRQRAVFVLRDVLGWSAKETASLLETSVAAANSALQRARAELQRHLPERRLEWGAATGTTESERAVLQRFMDALERADTTAISALLREDAIATMPPVPDWHDGRATIMAALAQSLPPGAPEHLGRFKALPVGANLQPAAAFYLRRPGDTAFRPFAIDLLRIADGRVAEITSFIAPGAVEEIDYGPDLFAAFGLPAALTRPVS
jgi:RNA polymerase sigma-70 factor (ECF subfamily)